MENRHVILTIRNERLKGILKDNVTTRGLIEKLPLAMTMHDLHNREKYVKISDLAVDQINTSHYSKGDISYWTPGNAFVIYYKGKQEPLHGLVKLGEIVERFKWFR